MLKTTNRIIISTEAVNSFGFRTLTDGIDISDYEKNPIMLWMHLRAFSDKDNQILPLGNVIDLKFEKHEDYGRVLTGQPMFSEKTDFAKKIYDLVEEGTIRMCSAGLKPLSWSDEPELRVDTQTGYTMVTSKLKEVSIVDLGSNSEALAVALYDDDDELIQLSDASVSTTIPQFTKTQNENMKTIALNAGNVLVKLGLPDTADAVMVEAKVLDLVKLAADNAAEIVALTDGKKKADEKVTELTTKVEGLEKAATDSKIETLVNKAVADRKITEGEKQGFIELAAKDFAAVEKIFAAKVGVTSVESQLAAGVAANAEEYAGKSYKELDRSGKLVKLKADNPSLFAKLYKEEFGRDYNKA